MRAGCKCTLWSNNPDFKVLERKIILLYSGAQSNLLSGVLKLAKSPYCGIIFPFGGLISPILVR